jgi:hypothetical protein
MKYPYKGKSKETGLIVEFTAPKTGTVIETNSGHWKVGHYGNNWGEKNFTPIKEPNKFEFPIYIQCRDRAELKAAKSFLYEYGLKQISHRDGLTLYIHSNKEFSTLLDHFPNMDTFYENVIELGEFLKEDEIKAGDWVVCLSGFARLTQGKLYKTKLIKNPIQIIDDGGYSYIINKSHFRKAKPHEIPKIPVINGYEGKIEGNFAKYGCAEIDLDILRVFKSYNGNRQIESIKLNSGVEINAEDAAKILEYYEIT